MTNYCHLSYEDRKNIEDGLNENKSINQISKEINRNHSTILREIDRNKKYYMVVVREDNINVEVWRHDIIMDIAFADDYGFGF